jgi:hypothetical protein
MNSSIDLLTKSPELKALSQTLRIVGCAGGIIFALVGPQNPVSSTALVFATAAPLLRIPFYLAHTARQSTEACDGSKPVADRLLKVMGAAFLALLSFRMVANYFSPLSNLSSAAGVCLPYLKVCEMGLAIGVLLWTRSSEKQLQPGDLGQLLSNGLDLATSLALLNISPIPHKSLISQSVSFGLGILSSWSLPMELPQELPPES